MNRRKLAVAIMFSLVGFGGVSSAAYVHSTIARYRDAAPCGKLKGVPRLLQAAKFIPTGNCFLTFFGGCASTGPCTIINPPSGGTTTGNCTTVNNLRDCVCKAGGTQGAARQ
jgi:hypothetical protein